MDHRGGETRPQVNERKNMTKKYAKILIDDLEYKKHFQAHYGTECDVCSGNIEEDEDFVFMGDGQKVCVSCLGELQESLEELCA